MKRVLLVISSLNYGGAQRALANMSLAFPEEYQVDFLLNDSEDISYDYRGNIIDLGIKPVRDRTNLLYQIHVFIKRFIKLRKLKASGKYTACISALSSANAVNVLTGNKYCRTIISIRNFMSTSLHSAVNLKNMIEAYALKKLSNGADYVVTVSESLKQDIIKNFGVKKQKAITIYNGYDLSHIENKSKDALTESEKCWLKDQSYTIATAGRLDEQKGQAYLIRAIAKVKTKVPNIRLLVLGEGELRGKLEQLIEELQLQKNVVLCGFVNNPYKIIRNCDLFALPSLYEGFPNALAESLCLGIPVLSTDCDSGPREILAPKTDLKKKVTQDFERAEYGILCPLCDADAMAEAILYLLRNQDVYEYYQKQCKERAQQLSIDKVIGDWIRLIEK